MLRPMFVRDAGTYCAEWAMWNAQRNRVLALLTPEQYAGAEQQREAAAITAVDCTSR